MQRLYAISIIFLSIPGLTQTAKAAGKTDTTVVRYTLQYDPVQLRIPGKSFDVGVSVQDGGSVSRTEGFLKGSLSWSKYRLEVEGGRFSNGRISLDKNSHYMKGDSITVNVYSSKWLFGGKGKWLFAQKMAYNYETGINILTTGNIGRAPGDHVRFGIRTLYDNKLFADKWFPIKRGAKAFLLDFDGGHLSKSKGDLKIDNDLARINGDRVRLIAALAKNPAIRDTFGITLNYVAGYQCRVQARGNGHDLHVTADTYYDSLIDMRLVDIIVDDSEGHKTYHYRINPNGGSITISSKGGDGLDGYNGLDGLPGLDGAAGTFSTDYQTTINPDGTTQSVPVTVQGAGGDGQKGGDGDNGKDGNDGGDGGNITITYTIAAKPFLNLINAVSLPGKGGSGGRGGTGGRGGFGGSGNPSGNAGSAGMDGRNGFDGKDGIARRTVFVQKE